MTNKPTELDKLHTELELLEGRASELLTRDPTEETEMLLGEIEEEIDELIRKIVSVEKTGKLPDPFEILKYLH